MASNRAFKNLASLRHSFEEPLPEEIGETSAEAQRPFSAATDPTPSFVPPPAPMLVRSHEVPHPVSPITGKIDRRRLKKVLKTPSVSLSVAVRAELHEEVSAMLFARKTTWIAVLDELLAEYVAGAKARGQFPK